MKTGLVMEHEVDQDGLEEVDVDMIAKNIQRAISVFKDSETYTTMQKAAMSVADEYSWANSAKQYISTFASIGCK